MLGTLPTWLAVTPSPLNVSDVDVMSAVASPVLATSTVTENACPCVMFGGAVTLPIESAAAACTLHVSVTFAELATTTSELSASVPVAVASSVTGPSGAVPRTETS
ncbi:MAG: hypothetical protein HY816_18310 [Candidatus Wallbacteria bacterium]|nr:hypothetical protein [Candidatus Wallbacteria bacterium]